MVNKSLPIVAAIPNYNMDSQLKMLLPEVLKQGYDRVYVLDDASTDASKATVEGFGKGVTFVEGKVNLGGGGNRNRILGELATTSIVHFLDADVTLESENMADTIRSMGIDTNVGFIGGLVLDESGVQSIWNYGPRQTLVSGLGAHLLWQLGREETRDKAPQRALLNLLSPRFKNRPVPGHSDIEKRKIFWALESNLIIRSDTLEHLGGFDPSIREHDIQPLAFEAEKQGLYNLFDPSIVVTQHDVDVRDYNRDSEKIKAELYLTKKYGILRWLLNMPSKKV